MLQDVFGENVRVVLDTFHALQRVVRTVKSGDLKEGKNKGKRILFFRKLRTIFRQTDDHGEKRLKPTTTADQICQNINDLLSEFHAYIRVETVKELEKIRDKHSACLECIPCQVGTQKNEGIHRNLNKFFKGRGILSLEKAIALLACFLNKHNQDICGSSTVGRSGSFNDIEPFSTLMLQNYGILSKECDTEERLDPSIDQDLVNEVNQNTIVISEIVQNMHIADNMYKPLEVVINCPFTGLPKDCKNKCLEEETLAKFLSKLNLSVGQAKEGGTLLQTLSMCGDLHDWDSDESVMFKLLKECLSSHYDTFKKWFSSKNEHTIFARGLSNDANDTDTSDILLNVAASELRSVIIVFSCSRKAPIQTIIPHGRILKKEPLLLAFCPHKDKFYYVKQLISKATQNSPKNPGEGNSEKHSSCQALKKCTCGRGNKGKAVSCQGTRCPCFKRKFSCDGCDCLGCGNGFGKRSEVQHKVRSCRCGESNNESVLNCQKNRCPCFKNKWSCNVPPICECKKCENVFGTQERKQSSIKERAPKRQTGSDGKVYRFSANNSFHEHIGLPKKQSIWTEPETIAVFLCELSTPISKGRYKKIQNLFNRISSVLNDVTLRPKRFKQILFKLRNIHSYDYVYCLT